MVRGLARLAPQFYCVPALMTPCFFPKRPTHSFSFNMAAFIEASSFGKNSCPPTMTQQHERTVTQHTVQRIHNHIINSSARIETIMTDDQSCAPTTDEGTHHQQHQTTSQSSSLQYALPSIPPIMLIVAAVLCLCWDATAFVVPASQRKSLQQLSTQRHGAFQRSPIQRKSTSPTSLSMVWWFGGTPGTSSETSTSGEECELVAVRIDRTSANSRRIAGEIVVAAPMMDVWAILTDYDNLSTHVPNLVASKRISGGQTSTGEAGDGAYKCRLYQRGAQKIIGFEFGADVTMDMREEVVVAGKSGSITKSHELDAHLNEKTVSSTSAFPEERRINFKCVDSQFFSEFDGTWSVSQLPDNPFTGEPETTVSYTVDVRPKGPVPVAALEWRIREDVPTNLRAVKRAATEVGLEGVMAKKTGGRVVVKKSKVVGAAQAQGFADFILDYENETLGAYLE